MPFSANLKNLLAWSSPALVNDKGPGSPSAWGLINISFGPECPRVTFPVRGESRIFSGGFPAGHPILWDGRNPSRTT